MKTTHFPTTVVDDFFDYPDQVREFALQQTYTKAEDNRWPGKRSEELSVLSPILFNLSLSKIMSLFYNLQKINISWVSNACFQMVDGRYDDGSGASWVHVDDNIVTAIVYLSKSNNKSGTTIYRPIDPLTTSLRNLEHKERSFEDPEFIPAVKDFKLENNKQFKPSVTVEEEYNRLVLFDGHLYHSANNFYGSQDEDARLTLIFFITQINVSEGNIFPISRLKTVFGS
jgi:hypothetical protein